MGKSDHYRHGSNNVICEICGFKYKRHQLSKQWDNVLACRGGDTNECWSERHPQEFVKGRADKQIAPVIATEPDADFVAGTDWVTNNGDVVTNNGVPVSN